MKKTTLILIAFLSFFLSQAQVDDRHMDLGVKGGLNFATFNQTGIKYDTRISWNGGILLHMHFATHWAVQPELVFSSQGAEFDFGGSETTYEYSYLNVPILLQYMFLNGLRIETGPQIGFLTSAEVESNGNEDDVSRNVEDLDFSWALGASFLFKNGFGINARYNFGIANINNAGSPSVSNGVFQVGVFYHFITWHRTHK